MEFPKNLKYTKEHEWILIEDNKATIGITDFAQSELGDIIYVEIDKTEKEIQKDMVFGTVEAVKTVSDLFMPITGKIIERNDIMNTNPETVNTDPYNTGWIIKIEIKDTEEIKDLLTEEEYRNLVGY
jgi:glycine cleavage system H protein